jgi:hypothetical protein
LKSVNSLALCIVLLRSHVFSTVSNIEYLLNWPIMLESTRGELTLKEEFCMKFMRPNMLIAENFLLLSFSLLHTLLIFGCRNLYWFHCLLFSCLSHFIFIVVKSLLARIHSSLLSVFSWIFIFVSFYTFTYFCVATLQLHPVTSGRDSVGLRLANK